MSIDILSSASYPIPERLERGSASRAGYDAHPTIFYGGLTLVQDDNDTMNSANEQQKQPQRTRPSRKSAGRNSNKNNENDEGVSKRKRGRPRVLDKDENAAERRRTQIRLAQRAYRSRKEATISELSERLGEIDVAIQEMTKSFGSFRDELVSSGLLLQNPHLKQGLQSLAEKAEALVSLSSAASGIGGSSKSVSDDAEDVQPRIPASTPDETGSNSSLPDVGADGFSIDQIPSAMEDSSNEYNALYASANDTSSFRGEPLLQGPGYGGGDNHNLVNNNDNNQQAAGGMQMINLASIPPYTQGQPSLSENLPLPCSYSFRESTFARRLRRRCIEYGYRLLSDSRADPRDLARMFCFSLGIRNHQAVIGRFQTSLSCPSFDEGPTTIPNNMQQVAIPSCYNVGNAGMHYPYSKPTINPSSSSSSSSSSSATYPISKFIGPWPFHMAGIPHDKTSLEELLLSTNMSGEWFDAYDVEGYLKEMGIAIDAQSAFVTIPSPDTNLSIEALSSSSSSSNGNSPPPPASSSSISMQIDPLLESSTSASTTDSASMLPFEPSDMNVDMDMDINLLASTIPLMTEPEKINTSQPALSDYPLNMSTIQPEPLPSFTSSANNINNNNNSNNSLILDVEGFLDRLMLHAVCLGEKAGYRKQDVDDSLRVTCYPIF